MARQLSHIPRTLEFLRGMGMMSEKVEHWNPYGRRPDSKGERKGPPGIRQDLFGFIDIISVDSVRGVVGVQVCGQTGFADHIRKITDECRDSALQWLGAPKTEIWLVSWRKRKIKRGGKAYKWTPKIHVFSKEDFAEEVAQ